MSDFKGFPVETIAFLEALEENNNKAWMDDNRTNYQNYFVETAKDTVVALGNAIRNQVPDLVAIPKINKSIFRLNKDMRFSKGVPYKTWMGIKLLRGNGLGKNFTGFYFQLSANDIFIAVGQFDLKDDKLERYREAVGASKAGDTLKNIISDLSDQGYEIGKTKWKKVPGDYGENHKHADLLKQNGIFAMKTLPHPKTLHTPKIINEITTHFKTMLPLSNWTIDHL